MVANIENFIKKIFSGERRAVAQAITLLESSSVEDQEIATQVMQRLPQRDDSLRIGITGAPGAGKSTFIEALGAALLDEGNSLGVLAVDPSSPLQGGALLADKTRMARLSRDPAAFVRPSPSGAGRLGGLRSSTGETIQILEAAGFDHILLETVGVGQNELDVVDFVDLVVVLLTPLSGDGLQALKRGVLEVADLIVLNKADGEYKSSAAVTAQHYRQVLQGQCQVLEASALTGTGINQVWEALQILAKERRLSNEFEQRRQHQKGRQFEQMILEHLRRQMLVSEEFQQQKAAVEAGEITPRLAISLLKTL